MAKITSKLQVTIPKALAERYGLRPGSEIAFVPAGEVIRVVPGGRSPAPADVATRLELFDQATGRQRRRNTVRARGGAPASRGWRREELYRRGRPG